MVPEQGSGWQVYYAFFAREGFTDAARAESEKYSSRLLTSTLINFYIGDMERRGLTPTPYLLRVGCWAGLSDSLSTVVRR